MKCPHCGVHGRLCFAHWLRAGQPADNRLPKRRIRRAPRVKP